jgi:hypothetical protein
MYGKGTVLSHNSITDCVVVALAWGGDDFDATATMTADGIKPISSSQHVASPKIRFPAFSTRSAKRKTEVTGATVDTMYGMGTVISHDIERGLVVVLLAWTESSSSFVAKAMMQVGDVEVLKQSGGERNKIVTATRAAKQVAVRGTHNAKKTKKRGGRGDRGGRCSVM